MRQERNAWAGGATLPSEGPSDTRGERQGVWISEKLDQDGVEGITRLYCAAQIALGYLLNDPACPKNIQGSVMNIFMSINLFSPPSLIWAADAMNRLWCMETATVAAQCYSGAEVLSELSREVERYADSFRGSHLS